MNRREFLGTGALAALGTAAGCRICGYRPKPFMVNGVRIGVQMYSVDELWKSNPSEAFRKFKAMGYDGVQSVHFFFMKPDELEKMLSDNGLVLADMPFRKSFVAPDKFNEYRGECWGKIDNGYLYLIKSVFDREMSAAGYNSTSFLSWAKRNGLLITDNNRRTKNAQINGTVVMTVCLNRDACRAKANPDD